MCHLADARESFDLARPHTRKLGQPCGIDTIVVYSTEYKLALGYHKSWASS
jgi:hypothetical protein